MIDVYTYIVSEHFTPWKFMIFRGWGSVPGIEPIGSGEPTYPNINPESFPKEKRKTMKYYKAVLGKAIRECK